MKSFFIQKNSLFLLLGGIVIIGGSMVYLFTTGNTVTQQPHLVTPTTKVLYTPQTELTPSPPTKACSSQQRNFQTGVAFYHSWESTSSAPPDLVEQAAACDTALTNIIFDHHILGSFFWGWDDVGTFSLNGLQAATVIHTHYESLQA